MFYPSITEGSAPEFIDQYSCASSLALSPLAHPRLHGADSLQQYFQIWYMKNDSDKEEDDNNSYVLIMYRGPGKMLSINPLSQKMKARLRANKVVNLMILFQSSCSLCSNTFRSRNLSMSQLAVLILSCGTLWKLHGDLCLRTHLWLLSCTGGYEHGRTRIPNHSDSSFSWGGCHACS